MHYETEVLVVGGGPGGASAAWRLKQLGIPCILADAAVFPRDKICGDALSGKVVSALRRLDPAMPANLYDKPFTRESWGIHFFAPGGQCLTVPFKVKQAQQTLAPGYIAARKDFDCYLWQKAVENPKMNEAGVMPLQNCVLRRYEKKEGGWHVEDSRSKITIQAKVLIVADGANSYFARHIAGQSMDAAHHAAGIRVYARGVEDTDAQGFIELHFLKALLPGYFWIFPMADGRCNVGLGVRSDVIAKKSMDLKSLFWEIVHHHPQLSKRFQNTEWLETPKGFGLPLGSSQRKLYGDGYMLVGDAGSLIDPFTGEGIGHAMISGIKSAEAAASFLQGIIKDFSGYQSEVTRVLGAEFSISRRLQQLVVYPWLFDWVVNRARNNPTLQDLMSCMFEDLDVRAKLKEPSFYLNLLFKRKVS